MADESAVTAPPPVEPPVAPKPPWLLVGGILLAAWWWEKKFKGKSVSGAIADTLLGDDDDDEDSDDEEQDVADVDWTDEPVGKGRTKRRGRPALSDVGGPVTDVYIQPIKLATTGNCDEAVALLDQQSRKAANWGPSKKQVVRRALRRAATLVTEKCPKQVYSLIEASAEREQEWQDEVDSEVQRADTLRRPEASIEWQNRPRRRDVMLPGPKGARSFDPRKGTVVRRDRGEGGRFKRKTGTQNLEYRRKGPNKWRVLDLHTGAQSEKTVPTGKPRGRPKKLQ